MQCPIDGTALVMTERSGVEIDYCPKCRGVWLDRGELDKIIERAAPPAPPVALSEPPRAPQPPQPPQPPRGYAPEPQRGYADDRRYRDDDDDDRRRYSDDDRHYGKKRKREGFLSDLFDF